MQLVDNGDTEALTSALAMSGRRTTRRLALVIAVAHLGVLAHAALHVHQRSGAGTWVERRSDAPGTARVTTAADRLEAIGDQVALDEGNVPCVAMLTAAMAGVIERAATHSASKTAQSPAPRGHPDASTSSSLTPLALAPKASPPSRA